MKGPINIWEWRERAQRRLPRAVFDYLDGGAEDESCLRRNRAAIEAVHLRPAMLNDVSNIDMSVEILGQRFDLPIAITPTGLNGLFWPDGDIALARAAAACKIPFTLSTPSSVRLERIPTEAGGTHWMHAHTLQEQNLLPAPLIVRSAEDVKRDGQEVVTLLHDFSFILQKNCSASSRWLAPAAAWPWTIVP